MKNNIWQKRQIRKKRNQTKLTFKSDRPRLTVFRSNKHIYSQIIDPKNKKVLVWANDKNMTDKKGIKTARAEQVGTELARKAKKSKITTVVFDRGQYQYHGRVKALANAARKGGLNF